ncbi:DDT domain-containing protein DDR4-like [Phragmites australis]|uniref:DDT domain-containing protein DDR4-like n=1 Tax=Phragmites australis TaxID=29695 RepID=UPI002D792889|nr:DDT domain-containing protein DDR4-like [Phragmites australis]
MASPAKRAKPSLPGKPPGTPSPEDASATEDPVVLLRRRWELASVLHFLRVFEPVIEGGLRLSAEEIETALVLNNRDLARIHIALLKGIPPVNKNLKVEDGWIIVTAKKLSDWWSWVAEGANPLRSNPGKEVETYKQQDSIKRLLILKALCEVRSEQDDAVWYVNDEMKKGIGISNFRKEKLGSGSNGTIYWYDGDSTIGHRLYTEDVTVDYKQNWKGKGGHLTKPVINIHWETVATNLDEFLEISEKLCRKGRAESAIAEYLKTEIVPAVEKLQKKKERDFKRQQKKDELLAFAHSFQPRSLRERRRVSYNYSDYDRSIEEAIRDASRAKEYDSHEAGTKEKRASHQGDKGANGRSNFNSEHNKDGQEDAIYLSDLSSDDDEDRDYSDKDGSSANSDGDNNSYDPHRSDLEEEDAFVTRKKTRLAARLLNDKPRQGLRRSQRNVKNSKDTMHPGQHTPQAMTKKTLRQRPTPVSKHPDTTLSGSEDDPALNVADFEDEPKDDLALTVADSEDESE